jgi:four helix bundle protein
LQRDALIWLVGHQRTPHLAGMGSHNDLKAYVHARKLASMCRDAAETFPPHEARLADQLRRAADSVVLNIGEGNARGTNRQFRQFLETARASLKEVDIAVDVASDARLITGAELEALRAQIDETARTLYGLLRSISERIDRGENERWNRYGTRPKPPPEPPAA